MGFKLAFTPLLFSLVFASHVSLANSCYDFFNKHRPASLALYLKQKPTKDTAALWLPKNQSISHELASARAQEVAHRENQIRKKEGLPAIDGRSYITTRSQYRGPTLPVSLQRRRGTIIHIGKDFALIDPQLGRYNGNLLVYFFIPGTSRISHTLPFREFIIPYLKGGDQILLTRVIMDYSKFQEEAQLEYQGWKNRSVEILSEKNHRIKSKAVEESHNHLLERIYHFGIGQFIINNASSKYRVSITVPRDVLADWARKGWIEFGVMGPSIKSVEILISESAWPELLKQNIQASPPENN